MELILKRVLFTDDGVPGVLVLRNRPICLTLEEEWKNNEKGISCIPEGSYLCQKFTRPSGMETYQVMNVPGRTLVLFHPGTTELDTEGCIITGMEYGELQAKDDDSDVVEKQLAVLRSKEAFERFMQAVDGHASFVLTIRNC